MQQGAGKIVFLFFQLMIILACTKLAGELSIRCGQPSVLGKLVSGIVIGPAVLGWIQNTEIISQLSTVGVLLLMFIAGLETDLDMLNKNRNASLAVATGGVLLPMAAGWLGGQLIGMSMAQSLFMGLLFSATSVSISVQTLKELEKLNTRESAAILGAAIVDDILVVVLLAVLMSFLHAGEVSIAMILGKKAVFFIGIWLLGREVVPAFMQRFAAIRVSEAVLSAALIVCFFFAYLAESLGVAGIIGSFAAGIAIGRTKYKNDVERRVSPVAYAVFVPVFFVSIGLVISFTGVWQQLWLIAALTIAAVLAKLIGAAAGARLTGFHCHSSLCIGAGMISRGEVALILATIGLESQLLEPDYFTAVIIVVILTTLIAPPLLKQLFSGLQPSSRGMK